MPQQIRELRNETKTLLRKTSTILHRSATLLHGAETQPDAVLLCNSIANHLSTSPMPFTTKLRTALRFVTFPGSTVPLRLCALPRHCYSTPARSTQCFTVTWLFYAMPAPNPASLYRYFALRYYSIARLHLTFRHSTTTVLVATLPSQRLKQRNFTKT